MVTSFRLTNGLIATEGDYTLSWAVNLQEIKNKFKGVLDDNESDLVVICSNRTNVKSELNDLKDRGITTEGIKNADDGIVLEILELTGKHEFAKQFMVLKKLNELFDSWVRKVPSKGNESVESTTQVK